MRVSQNGSTDEASDVNLKSNPSSRVVALIDRTANVDEAARWLATARFSFAGRSPYAPDLVLVNEHVKRPFLDAVARHTIPFLTRVSPTKEKGNLATNGGKRPIEILDSLQASRDAAHLVTSGDGASVVDVLSRYLFILSLTRHLSSLTLNQSRSVSVLSSKISEPCLVVHAVRSLDDGIDLSQR